MSGWAGFWIGCGLVVLGIGVGNIGECIETAARILAEAYTDTFCEEEEDDNE